MVKQKSKTMPVQIWTDHEGCRRFRLSDFQAIGTLWWEDCRSVRGWVDHRII